MATRLVCVGGGAEDELRANSVGRRRAEFTGRLCSTTHHLPNAAERPRICVDAGRGAGRRVELLSPDGSVRPHALVMRPKACLRSASGRHKSQLDTRSSSCVLWPAWSFAGSCCPDGPRQAPPGRPAFPAIRMATRKFCTCRSLVASRRATPATPSVCASQWQAVVRNDPRHGGTSLNNTERKARVGAHWPAQGRNFPHPS